MHAVGNELILFYYHRVFTATAALYRHLLTVTVGFRNFYHYRGSNVEISPFTAVLPVAVCPIACHSVTLYYLLSITSAHLIALDLLSSAALLSSAIRCLSPGQHQHWLLTAVWAKVLVSAVSSSNSMHYLHLLLLLVIYRRYIETGLESACKAVTITWSLVKLRQDTVQRT